MAFFNSSFHNLQHVCAMAELLWSIARVSIGRFSEQANEGMNKALDFELVQRCKWTKIDSIGCNCVDDSAVALQPIPSEYFGSIQRVIAPRCTKLLQACS